MFLTSLSTLWFLACFLGCNGDASGQEKRDLSKEITNTQDMLHLMMKRLDNMDAKVNRLAEATEKLKDAMIMNISEINDSVNTMVEMYDMDTEELRDVIKSQILSEINQTNMMGVLEPDDLTSLKEDMDKKYSAAIKVINARLDAQDINLNQLRHQNTEDGSTLGNANAMMHYFISFTAFAMAEREYNDGERVLFDGIVNNYGDKYNEGTSVFTCEYTGYYLFSVNILSAAGYNMAAVIKLNDTELIRVLADDVTNTNNQASNMVVALCPVGGQVYVECYDNGRRMRGSDSTAHSTFVGTLLHSLVP